MNGIKKLDYQIDDTEYGLLKTSLEDFFILELSKTSDLRGHSVEEKMNSVSIIKLFKTNPRYLKIVNKVNLGIFHSEPA